MKIVDYLIQEIFLKNIFLIKEKLNKNIETEMSEREKNRNFSLERKFHGKLFDYKLTMKGSEKVITKRVY